MNQMQKQQEDRLIASLNEMMDFLVNQAGEIGQGSRTALDVRRFLQVHVTNVVEAANLHELAIKLGSSAPKGEKINLISNPTEPPIHGELYKIGDQVLRYDEAVDAFLSNDERRTGKHRKDTRWAGLPPASRDTKTKVERTY